MFFITTVTKWVSNRDGKARISTMDTAHGRTFVLNTNRITDLLVNGSGSKFYFYDNHLDRRENRSYIECNSTVAQIETARNLSVPSKFVTIDVFRNRNINNSPTSICIPVEAVAYLDAYRPAPPVATWLIYMQNSFKRVELLVDKSLQDMYYFFYGETSETTGQYVYYEDGIAQWRKGSRDGYFMLDHAMTGIGFAGMEDTDWEMVKQRN